jgi:ATP-dependent DNA helicase RecG
MIDEQAHCLSTILCAELKGVGPKVALYLKKLNIVTIQDLLFHLPLRYEDRTVLKKINQLLLGDQVLVQGEIIHVEIQQSRRKSLLCRIKDGQGVLVLRFFNFNPRQIDFFKNGLKLQCFGEVRRGVTGYEMIHPEYRFIDENNITIIDDTLTPVYPTTEGLNQYILRKLTDQALSILNNNVLLPDFLPSKLLQSYDFSPLSFALNYVHRPPREACANLLNQGIHHHQQRLVFEELLAHQLSLAQLRHRVKKLQAVSIQMNTSLVAAFKKQLAFELTTAQEKVLQEISRDLQKNAPMLRLVQGDVGSGKTVVAAIAALLVVENGLQVAIMAPTELLAEQHFKVFQHWFSPLGISVGWLTGTIRGKQKENSLQTIKNGEVQVVVGTHALFQEKTIFQRLGLIVIDEQHRFGVDQRLSLLNKGIWQNNQPHQLIMSATPIPRTLAMTAYGDLDCSVIDELPPGRTPIETIVMPQSKRSQLVERIKVNCEQGAQVYWVCTLIEESELLQCQAAQEVTKELVQLLPELRIGLIHGRMKPKEKEQTMLAFKEKELHLLVATTVIEVGVDVPNASLMIIENSERLGLSQLHQLRGRVGRGSTKSYCVLLYQAPLSKHSQERLSVLRDNTDGFIIAEKDLQLRGPGEILGTRQTGLMQLKIADLVRDQHQLPAVQEAATLLVNEYPEAVEGIINRWLANSERFTGV